MILVTIAVIQSKTVFRELKRISDVSPVELLLNYVTDHNFGTTRVLTVAYKYRYFDVIYTGILKLYAATVIKSSRHFIGNPITLISILLELLNFYLSFDFWTTLCIRKFAYIRIKTIFAAKY